MLQIQAHDAILRRHGEGFETSPAPNRNGSYEDHVMASKALPSPEVLRQLLRYEPDTGKLFWLPRGPEMFKDGYRTASGNCTNWNARYSGSEAFTALDRNGYRHGTVFNVHYMAHRLAWVLHYGIAPVDQIDHINGDAQDNRIVNLRSVSQAQNMRNLKQAKNNTSGVTGVRWRQDTGKWETRVIVQGRRVFSGSFSSMEEAISARRAAEAAHGYHPNHGGVR